MNELIYKLILNINVLNWINNRLKTIILKSVNIFIDYSIWSIIVKCSFSLVFNIITTELNIKQALEEH